MLEKNKILIKLVITILVVFALCFNLLFISKVEAKAAKSGDDMLDQMQSDIDSFKKAGQENKDINVDDITQNFVNISQILTMIGAGVMVAVTTYMGIKYLMSGPNDQAKLKTQLIGVVVAGIVIFGAFSIWKLIIQIVSTC